MAAESMHMTISIRSTTIAHQEHYLVEAFRIQAPEIPHHCRTLCMCSRIPFLGMNEIRKLLRILNKEDRSIISNKVPVSIFCIEFHSKSAWVSFCIRRSLLAANGGKTQEDPGLFSNLVKDFCPCKVCNIICDGERAVSTCAFRMHNTLWNALTIKVSHLFVKYKIL